MSAYPPGPPGHPVPPPAPARRRLSGVWVAFAVVASVFVVLLGITLALLLPDDEAADTGAPAGGGSASEPATPDVPPSSDVAGATPLDGDVVVADDVDEQWFRSPSGNITCRMARDAGAGAPGVECAIGSVTWTVEQPADCDLAWGGGQDGTGRLLVTGTDPGTPVCAGDVLDPGSSEVVEVPYGQAIWLLDEIVCRSAESGMRCESLASGHGFAVSRASVDLY